MKFTRVFRPVGNLLHPQAKGKEGAVMKTQDRFAAVFWRLLSKAKNCFRHPRPMCREQPSRSHIDLVTRLPEITQNNRGRLKDYKMKTTMKKVVSTHPISPITRIITISLTVEILHTARDQFRFVLIPELQPLPRMLFISIVNH